jgi:hypothetical protein
MFFKHSLIAVIMCAGVIGCAANPNPEATFFLPGTDSPIAVGGPTWEIAPIMGTTWWGELTQR